MCGQVKTFLLCVVGEREKRKVVPFLDFVPLAPSADRNSSPLAPKAKTSSSNNKQASLPPPLAPTRNTSQRICLVCARTCVLDARSLHPSDSQLAFSLSLPPFIRAASRLRGRRRSSSRPPSFDRLLRPSDARALIFCVCLRDSGGNNSQLKLRGRSNSILR